MADEKQPTENTSETPIAAAVQAAVAKSVYGQGGGSGYGQGGRGGNDRGRGGRPQRGDRRPERGRDEMEQRMLDIARVTRVMKGGKRMSFRACVAIGDKKGTIGIGLGKGADVTMAVNKAVNQAKKKLFKVSLVNDTIAHAVYQRTGAARIIFKPAAKGRGVIAGGVVRVILELAGVKNVTSKILGTGNKINNARCTLDALKKLKKVEGRENKEKTAEDKGADGKTAKPKAVETKTAEAKPSKESKTK
jgi:small subunit ribosomal protein S5